MRSGLWPAGADFDREPPRFHLRLREFEPATGKHGVADFRRGLEPGHAHVRPRFPNGRERNESRAQIEAQLVAREG